jgi:hypothetical protein
LILGLYEPAFIDEVIRLVGGMFFMSVGRESTVKDQPAPNPANGSRIAAVSIASGSMLPFSPGSAKRSALRLEVNRTVDHPSVSGWRISDAKMGNVFVPTAAILASNCDWEAKPHQKGTLPDGQSSSAFAVVTASTDSVPKTP